MNGSGGGVASFMGYVKDPGFWGAVVAVNLIVAFVLVAAGAPGYRR